jgi:hypothetical protein
VDELERVWRSITSDPADGRVSVDLTDVTFVGEEGKKLLEAMYAEGAKLKASGCVTRRLVEEIGHSFKKLSQNYVRCCETRLDGTPRVRASSAAEMPISLSRSARISPG